MWRSLDSQSVRLKHLIPFSKIHGYYCNTKDLPFPGCLNRELKGVFEAWFVGATPFETAWGCGLPLGIREDRCIGGGICTFEVLGLCRASLVPFGIALSAGDWPCVVSVFMPFVACSEDPLLSWDSRLRAGFGIDPKQECENSMMLWGSGGLFVTFTWCVAIGSRSYELLLTFERLVVYRH